MVAIAEWGGRTPVDLGLEDSIVLILFSPMGYRDTDTESGNSRYTNAGQPPMIEHMFAKSACGWLLFGYDGRVEKAFNLVASGSRKWR